MKQTFKIIPLKICLVLFFFIFCEHVHSQVTIGSLDDPLEGALLDIKTATDSTGGKTAEKGIVFPRVELVAINSLVPLLNTTEAARDPQKLAHKGVMVYNIATVNNLAEGLYCWDGEQWLEVYKDGNNQWNLEGNSGTDVSTNYIGTSDAMDLAIKTNNQERIFVERTGNVGIGTTTLATNLHVDGTTTLGGNTTVTGSTTLNGSQGVNITGLPTASGTYQNVTVNASTGQLQQAPVPEIPNSWNIGGNNDVADADAIIGTLNNVGLKFRVGASERMRINTAGRVGIGTTAPSTTLHIVPTLYSGTIPDALRVEGVSRLDGSAGVYISDLPSTTTNAGTVVVGTDGRLGTMGTATTKPMNYIQYTIENCAGDWVAYVDTNIPGDKYTLIIVSSQFSIPTPASTYGVIRQNPVVISDPDKLFELGSTPIMNVFAEIHDSGSGNTWHLYADYVEASTMDESRIFGTWKLDCLIIDNALVKNLNSKSIDLEGTNGYGRDLGIPSDL